ncbi:MAG: FtsX-like permease family protein, partial [Blastocatellia bacterium]
RTLGISLLEGRDFTEADWDNPLVTIIDQSLAKHYWPDQSAIGKRIRFGPPEANEPWHTIVGVVADTRNQSLYSLVRWNVYIPFSAKYTADQSLIARFSEGPLSGAAAVRFRVQGINRDIAVSQVLTMKQIIDQDSWQERFFAMLFAVFAALALLLAGVGLYGVLGYAVSLRTHEIGIRMALGANASQVRGMVMRQSSALVGAGVGLGLFATYGLTRLLASQLFSISPSDPATYLEVMIALIGVATVASYLPARRATRVEPVIALREE